VSVVELVPAGTERPRPSAVRTGGPPVWDLTRLHRVPLAAGQELVDLPGARWLMVLAGAVVLESARGVERLATHDAALVDARTAHRVLAIEPADVVVADLRVIAPDRRLPGVLVVPGFGVRHAGVAALVRACRLGGGCPEAPSAFVAGYGALLGAAMSESWTVPQPEATPADPVVAAVLAALSERPGEPWTVDRMGRVAHLSRSALGERFRRTLGRGPVEVLREVRMDEARRLLSDPARAVEHVARTVGYGSTAAFSRAFSAHHGLAPQAWRSAASTASGPREPHQGEPHAGDDGRRGPDQQRRRHAVVVQQRAS
jgi:AraC-like DNA-binding protein